MVTKSQVLSVAAALQLLVGFVIVFQFGFAQGGVFNPQNAFSGNYYSVDLEPVSSTISQTQNQLYAIQVFDQSGGTSGIFAQFFWSVDNQQVAADSTAGSDSCSVSGGSLSIGPHSVSVQVFVQGNYVDQIDCSASLTVVASSGSPTPNPTPTPIPTATPEPGTFSLTMTLKPSYTTSETPVQCDVLFWGGTSPFSLTVYLSSRSLGVVTVPVRSFHVSLPIWGPGNYVVFCTATDASGQTATSSSYTVVVGSGVSPSPSPTSTPIIPPKIADSSFLVVGFALVGSGTLMAVGASSSTKQHAAAKPKKMR